MLLNKERLALHVDPEFLWLSIGTDIIADSAILLSRWMLKPSRRTNKF
jgi:hypothetical protein